MENKHKPAFYNPNSYSMQGDDGLTKREYFAGLAMQGLLASMTEMSANGGSINKHHGLCESLAIECIDMADALLKQLEINN